MIRAIGGLHQKATLYTELILVNCLLLTTRILSYRGNMLGDKNLAANIQVIS
jgi:hypothetical protein